MHSPPPRAARKRSAQRPAVVVVEARIKPHSDSRYITFSKFYTAQARTASPPHKDAGREKPRASPPPPLPPTPPPPPPLPHRSGDRPVRRSRSRQPGSRPPAQSPAAALTPCRRPARWRHAAAELGPAQSRYRLPRSPLGTGRTPLPPFRLCRPPLPFTPFRPPRPRLPDPVGPGPISARQARLGPVDPTRSPKPRGRDDQKRAAGCQRVGARKNPARADGQGPARVRRGPGRRGRGRGACTRPSRRRTWRRTCGRPASP